MVDTNQPFYFCDPQKNTSCKKRRCALLGGPCYITLKAEHALLDHDGNPQVVTPKQNLELRACYALARMMKHKGAGGTSVRAYLNGEEIQSLIENGQLTINGARSMLGLLPIDTPCANSLLINKPD